MDMFHLVLVDIWYQIALKLQEMFFGQEYRLQANIQQILKAIPIQEV
jgi:hypothetical protein